MKIEPLALELLTPCWAGGAQPAEQAEIRVPTIRGQLRFWLRMLFPSRGLDEAVFGRADARGAVASRVAIHLAEASVLSNAQNLDDYTGKQGNAATSDPEAYFLWPLRPTRQSLQKRGVLLPRPNSAAASFTLRFTWLPPFRSEAAALLPSLEGAIRAFSLLGAFGTRSTRGYGSVWNPVDLFGNSESLTTALSFLPATIQVRLLPGAFTSGRGALAGAAMWMRSLRIGSATYGARTTFGQNDHDVADPSRGRRHNATVYRHALGMPLAQRFRRSDGTTTVSAKYSPANPAAGNGQMTDRYPSPVRIKVCRLNGKYRVLIVILRDLLLPEGTRIRLSAQGGYSRDAELSHKLVEHIAAEGIQIR